MGHLHLLTCTAAIVVAITACKLDSLSIRTLRLERADTRAEVVRVVVGAPSHVPPDTELAGARATCADDLTVALDAPNARSTRLTASRTTEVQIYGRSFNDMYGFLASLSRDEIERGLEATAAQRASQAWHPASSVPSGFPFTPVVTSTSTSAATGPVATRTIPTTSFWGDGPPAPGLPRAVTMCHPRGDAGALRTGASVQRLIAYDRGACSQDHTYAGLILDPKDNQHQKLVDALHTTLHLGIGSNTVSYSILGSYVRHAGGAFDPPSGGLVYFLKFVSRDLAGNAPSASWGSVRYELTLNRQGVVQIEPKQLAWGFDEGWGRLASEGAALQEGWRPALTTPGGTAVLEFQRALWSQQLASVQSDDVFAVLGRHEYDCDPSRFVATCKRAAAELGQVLAAQLKTRAGAGGKPLFTPAEIEQMRCAIGDPAGCAPRGRDADAIVTSRWACRKSPRYEQDHCDLIVPIARLLPMPDGISAVLFDGDELDNPAYVLEAASPGSVCKPPAAPSSRSFFSSVIQDGGARR